MSRRTTTGEPLLHVLEKHLSAASSLARCSFGYWLDKQDVKTQEAFVKLAESKNISSQKLYNDLVAAGIELPCKLTTFKTHMGGYCVCQKN